MEKREHTLLELRVGTRVLDASVGLPAVRD